jgi:N-acetylglutamate synthase-like GNAT family acetyltransferase
MVVKKSYETEWAARLERLRATIAAHMALVPERAITQVRFFFDVIDETGEMECVRLAAKYATKLHDDELLDRLLREAKENLVKQLVNYS